MPIESADADDAEQRCSRLDAQRLVDRRACGHPLHFQQLHLRRPAEIQQRFDRLVDVPLKGLGRRAKGHGRSHPALAFHKVLRSQFVESAPRGDARSEEHTSELQSLMRTSYAVFCLKKNKITNNQTTHITNLDNIRLKV